MSTQLEPTNSPAYPSVLSELHSLITTYNTTLTESFHFREHALITQLQSNSLSLQQEIHDLEALTSQTAVQGMIGKRKQEKEVERLGLEVEWRERMGRLKRLEEEEKRLVEGNGEARFDIGNLEEKIDELERENCRLMARIENMKKNKAQETFLITETDKKCYTSPYKANKWIRTTKLQSSATKMPQMSKNNHNSTSKNTNKIKKRISVKLGEVRDMKKVPIDLLIEFLSRKEIKNQIYDILRS